MTPTHSRPASRATTTVLDIDPFEEPSVPVATAIPLPLSPESSIITDRKAVDAPSLMTRSSTAAQSSASREQSGSQSSTPPPSVAASAAVHQTQPASAFSTLRGRSSRHHPSASQSSIPSAGVLSPPMIPSGANSNDARSPVARALSPSGVSDTMSLVSATPSRAWTDGGTGEIFSGDERDFPEAEAESDDDVRSVSESGSWQSLSASRDGLAASGRLPRR